MCRSNEENQFLDVFQGDKFTAIEGRGRKEKVEVQMKRVNGIVYLLCKSEGRKNKERAMRNSREKKLEKELEKLQEQIQNGRENDSVKIEQRIGRIKERFGKVSQYYEIRYARGEFSYILGQDATISKRFSNSLKNLQEKAAIKKAVIQTSTGGSETIMVVEDEELVRSPTARILAGYGYRVLTAGSGHEAMETTEGYEGSIHLMLTDVVMPGMSGKELVEELKRMRPEMKVLFMSGYTDNIILHQGVLDAGVYYLQKPFTPYALVRKVRDVLGAGS
jgi:CheY-like chemotaxis protein